jgi:hypothetical protein
MRVSDTIPPANAHIRIGGGGFTVSIDPSLYPVRPTSRFSIAWTDRTGREVTIIRDVAVAGAR